MNEATKFSDVLSSSLIKIYRVGGLVLVFIFVGVVTMIIGNFSSGQLAKWVFGVGAFITLICLGLFVYAQFQGPARAVRAVKENKETMDAIQDIAIELTRVTASIQSLTFKHIKQVNKVFETLVPLINLIPGAQKKLDDLGMSDAEKTSKAIVELSGNAEKVIRDIEDALVTADSRKLNKYAGELNKLTISLREALAISSIKKAK